MARMPTYAEIKDDFERGVRTAEQRIEHPFRRHEDTPAQGANPYTQTPAQQPVNLAPAAAVAATPQEETMSLAQDFEHGWTDVKNGVANFEQTILPAALDKIRKFEASPFAAIAEKAAASVLPPEAVAIAVGAAEKVIDDLSALYAPADPAPAGAAPAGQQPAPAQ